MLCRVRPKQGQGERACPGCWERLSRGCREPSEDVTGLRGARGTRCVYPRAHLPVLASWVISTGTVQAFRNWLLLSCSQLCKFTLVSRPGGQASKVGDRSWRKMQRRKFYFFSFFLTFKKIFFRSSWGARLDSTCRGKGRIYYKPTLSDCFRWGRNDFRYSKRLFKWK